MANISAKHIGVFRVYDNPGYTTGEMKTWIKAGGKFQDLKGVFRKAICRNLLMSSQKLLMAQAIYPTIDRLVVTSQTDQPTDSETTYTGALYTTQPGDEAFRSDPTNPYQLIWNIPQAAANGAWGSFILINSAGDMINRALAGVSKTSNQGKIVTFTGTVV